MTTYRRSKYVPRSHRPVRRYWMLFVIFGLALAVFFAVKAYRSEHPASPGEGPQSAEMSTPGHYTDLEIAEYTDPARRKGTITKDYEGFSLSFNPANGTADWVGWELLSTETDGPVKRNNQFWQDTEIEGSPSPSDYKNSGYDKGHLCPAADQKWSSAAMRDCFVMTNMTPQRHEINSGAWSTLEQKERLWAQRDSALIIVAGPIYDRNDKERIGANGVRVPSAFFKVLLAPYVENPRAIGFVYPNMTAPGNMQNYAMSVDEVEQLTGLDFFSSLPDDLEEHVESRFSFTEWNRK